MDSLFKYGKLGIQETINQIEKFLKYEGKCKRYISINRVRIDFDEFEYKEDEYDSGQYYCEFFFLKNKEKIADFSFYSDGATKIGCHLFSEILSEIETPEYLELIDKSNKLYKSEYDGLVVCRPN